MQKQSGPNFTGEGNDRAFLDRHALSVVTLLTLLGGAFRFATIDRPGLWYDEAQTYRRVCGTFAQMMGQLRGDGFMPLHYWVEWCIGRLVGGPGNLTPFWLRFVPALAGTAMIPAMYWLARQFCNRSTAVVVAAFTACSAYLNFYSHDAKMYMPLWLFAALSMASLLTWLRNGRRIAWVGWIVFATLMVGFHAMGLIVVVIEAAAFFVLRGPQPRRAAALWAGLFLITFGPAFYYVAFNRWAKNLHDAGWQGASGLHWAPYYNADRNRPKLVAYAASAYLTGWEWPARGRVRPLTLDDPAFLSRAATHGYFIAKPVEAAFELVNVGIGLVVLASLTWFVLRRGIKPNDDASWTRPSLILALWVVVPVFAFFEVATNPYPSRTRVAVVVPSAAMALMLVAPPAALGAAKLRRSRERFADRAARVPPAVLVAAIPAALCVLVALVVHAAKLPIPGWGGVWAPRYMGVVWPAFAVAVCSLLAAFPMAHVRRIAIAILLLANAAQSVARATVSSRPPVERLAADVWSDHDSGGATRTYLPQLPLDPELGESVFIGPGKYYLCMAAGHPLFTPYNWLATHTERVLLLRPAPDPSQIVADLAPARDVRHVVVWQNALADANALPDPVGAGWTKIADECVTVRDVWNWSKVYETRRREYVRATRQ